VVGRASLKVHLRPIRLHTDGSYEIRQRRFRALFRSNGQTLFEHFFPWFIFRKHGRMTEARQADGQNNSTNQWRRKIEESYRSVSR
jgi:hypothetical protein